MSVGPFQVRVTTDSPQLLRQLRFFYGDYLSPYSESEAFTDFYIELSRGISPLRLFHPQIHFRSDVESPFHPFRLDHGLPFFEWGLNWCIATRCHQYLMFHSAVLERNGGALLLPGLPGAGKSTLCAALTQHGWRLLSDEFCLYRPETREVSPLPRPIPLKNEAIAVFRKFAPTAEIGPEFPKTRKGTVAHVKPRSDSLRRRGETARPAWVAFPLYRADETTRWRDYAKGLAFSRLAHSSFNYSIQGARGFTGTTDLIRTCKTFEFRFDNLENAVHAVEEMVN